MASGDILGSSTLTSNGTSTSDWPTYTDIGLSVTVTVASRPIIVEFGCSHAFNTSTGYSVVAIRESSTVVMSSTAYGGSANQMFPCSISVRLAPSAGSHTYKISLARISAGTATIYGDATAPAYIRVVEG